MSNRSKTGGGVGTNQYAIKGSSVAGRGPAAPSALALQRLKADAAVLAGPVCHDTPDGQPVSYEEQYPVFVYGTLRKGEGNHRYILEGSVGEPRTGSVSGVAMYDNGGFPYATEETPEATDAVLHGELFDVNEDDWDATRRRLDMLEGFDPERRGNHYDRVLRDIDTGDGETTRAWMYTAPASVANHCPRIESGDWMAAREERARREEAEYEAARADEQANRRWAVDHDQAEYHVLEHFDDDDPKGSILAAVRGACLDEDGADEVVAAWRRRLEDVDTDGWDNCDAGDFIYEQDRVRGEEVERLTA